MQTADQQSSFNATTLQNARGFALSPLKFAQLAASAHRAADLQGAMTQHLWTCEMEACRALGFVIMPHWVEVLLCHAWDAHGADFIALAESEYARFVAAPAGELAA